MIRVTVLYPQAENARFDFDYYDGHIADAVRRLTPHGLRSAGYERGLGGAAPGAPAPFVCCGNLVFDSIDQFQAGFAEHGEALIADVPNFTNVQPVIQISEILK